MTDLIERMARAHLLKSEGLEWESVAPSARKFAIDAMRAAWAVAAEPTDAMLNAGAGPIFSETAMKGRWQAMHGAADD